MCGQQELLKTYHGSTGIKQQDYIKKNTTYVHSGMFPWRFWEPHALIHARPFISHIRIKSPPLNTVVVSYTRSTTRLPTRYSHFWHHSSDYDPIKAQKAKPFLTLNQITRAITSRTAKCIYILIGGGASVFYVQHLETAPVSGRKRFMYFTDADAEEEGKLIYASLMRENRHAILPSWDWRTQKVNRVMKRLIVASGLDNLDWEVNVISSNCKLSYYAITSVLY